jgi:hypothetical protein
MNNGEGDWFPLAFGFGWRCGLRSRYRHQNNEK